ncbi:MAG TPA: ATP-binding protein [Polyangium sp.]|nr:ATP-binding protein [Polyangium sp.]
MPFRTARKQVVAERPETGAVAEMVRQFADPYAFVRELVQNSIDAGASALSVRVERAGGIVTTALHDDGVGMTRATIDGPLLTLFNSSKEGDSSKIGKYGVGFVSVFAIDPETVEVDTWRDGQRYRIRLFRDHRYEIEKLAPLENSGTVVTLHQSMDAEKFDEHRRRLEISLSRWCRFAAVPIEFSSVDHDRNDPAAKRRIDLPLTVPSSLYVQTNRDKERFVVGPSLGTDRFLTAGVAEDDPAKGKQTFVGFYNRGLTLFETDEPLHPDLANVRLRVDSPHLRHTLSRDNVLRDKAFNRIITKARELVEKSLQRELSSRLSRAARDLAQAKPPYDPELLASYAAFLEASLTHPLSVPQSRVMFPLAAPWRDSNVMSLKEIMSYKGMYVVDTPSELVEAMSKAGHPVLLAPDSSIRSMLAMRIPLPGPITPERNFILLEELPEKSLSRTDGALCLALENHFLALGLGARPISFATPKAALEAPCVLGNGPPRRVGERLYLIPKEYAEDGWSNARPDGQLWLVTTNEAVQLARKHAEKDTFFAAHMLLRFLLLARSDADGAYSDALFSIAAMEVV